MKNATEAGLQYNRKHPYPTKECFSEFYQDWYTGNGEGYIRTKYLLLESEEDKVESIEIKLCEGGVPAKPTGIRCPYEKGKRWVEFPIDKEQVPNMTYVVNIDVHYFDGYVHRERGNNFLVIWNEI